MEIAILRPNFKNEKEERSVEWKELSIEDRNALLMAMLRLQVREKNFFTDTYIKSSIKNSEKIIIQFAVFPSYPVLILLREKNSDILFSFMTSFADPSDKDDPFLPKEKPYPFEFYSKDALLLEKKDMEKNMQMLHYDVKAFGFPWIDSVLSEYSINYEYQNLFSSKWRTYYSPEMNALLHDILSRNTLLEESYYAHADGKKYRILLKHIMNKIQKNFPRIKREEYDRIYGLVSSQHYDDVKIYELSDKDFKEKVYELLKKDDEETEKFEKCLEQNAGQCLKK